jgi:hypothetical protein
MALCATAACGTRPDDERERQKKSAHATNSFASIHVSQSGRFVGILMKQRERESAKPMAITDCGMTVHGLYEA